MADNKADKTKPFRDKLLQSNLDQLEIEERKKYIAESAQRGFVQLDNFTKYVQRTALMRFLARYEIFKLQLNTPGVVIDLGVGRGASLFAWAQMSAILEPVNYTREIIGFDTFEGIVRMSPEDENPHSSLMKIGGFVPEEGTYEDLLRAVAVFDVNRPLSHIPKIKVVKGDACETLPTYFQENSHALVSLLHLDTDLYEPTRVALQLALPRMSKGAVILFDELNMKFYPGETRALLSLMSASELKLKRFPWATTLAYAVIE